jgi:hypothetical protein
MLFNQTVISWNKKHLIVQLIIICKGLYIGFAIESFLKAAGSFEPPRFSSVLGFQIAKTKKLTFQNSFYVRICRM